VREGDAATLYLHDPALAAPVLQGAEFAAAPLLADGRFDLAAVMALLAARGINEVHVEAGPTLCGALLRAGLADELLLYMAPLLMGEGARLAAGGGGPAHGRRRPAPAAAPGPALTPAAATLPSICRTGPPRTDWYNAPAG